MPTSAPPASSPPAEPPPTKLPPNGAACPARHCHVPRPIDRIRASSGTTLASDGAFSPRLVARQNAKHAAPFPIAGIGTIPIDAKQSASGMLLMNSLLDTLYVHVSTGGGGGAAQIAAAVCGVAAECSSFGSDRHPHT